MECGDSYEAPDCNIFILPHQIQSNQRHIIDANSLNITPDSWDDNKGRWTGDDIDLTIHLESVHEGTQPFNGDTNWTIVEGPIAEVEPLACAFRN